MTPEHWRRVGELFEAATRVEPAGRETWLRAASGGDEALRAEVARLLSQDERADRDGFLSSPGGSRSAWDKTGSWHQNSPESAGRATGSGGRAVASALLDDDTGGFTPRQVIAPRPGRHTVSEPPDVVRARLRELPVVYILIIAALTLWRRAVLGQDSAIPDAVNITIVVLLVGLIALLSTRLPISLARLKALELGMVAMLAGRFAWGQYRMMLQSSSRGDVMLAQLTMKNIVLLTTVLILTYGLYVPKSWRRAAMVVLPLALLPFTTLGVLAQRHPVEMAWLWAGWRHGDTPRALLFTLDALILLILAVCSAYGARTMSRLRRQAAEARRLGQYCLGDRLGVGGMGEVYLAEHMLLKRPCAVKFIRAGDEADAKALGRFEREVRLTSTLSHPNTIDVYDYGRSEDGSYYYVMEYLKGMSLSELVERHGPLPPGRTVFLLRQVCGALREAHAAGLIHRDIKPSNIFSARRGGMGDVAKLLDFGLVMQTAIPRAAAITGEGQVIGTPLYMAPEQATGGHKLDERTDIYSLGAVAYYLLTGRPPFDGQTGMAVLIAHARDPVKPPSELQSGIPEDLERVVLRCLAKAPAERFPAADDLGRALAACRSAGDWDQDHADRWWRSHDARKRDGALAQDARLGACPGAPEMLNTTNT
jgi:serine/threonine-protein kinase